MMRPLGETIGRRLPVYLLCVAMLSLGVWAIGHNRLSTVQKATIDKYGNGGTIESVKRENEDGIEVMTVRQKSGNRTMEIQVTPGGELNATEEKITIDELPQVVKNAARKYFPKGLKGAEKSVMVVYEVEGKDAEGHRREIRITRPGIVLLPAGHSEENEESDLEKD